MAAEAEDFLVVHARTGAQLFFKIRHQRPVIGNIFRRGDNRDFKDAGHLHKPGYALDQRLSPIQGKLCQKVILNIDDNEARIYLPKTAELLPLPQAYCPAWATWVADGAFCIKASTRFL